VQPCGADLSEVARYHTTGNLHVSIEHWKKASDGLEQCGFTCTVGTYDSDTLAAAKGEAACTGDLNLRRLSIPNGGLAETQRFGRATPSSLSSDRKRVRLALTNNRLNCSKTALMLVHLGVLAMASIRLNELPLTLNLFLTAICVALVALIGGTALLRIGAVVASEASHVMSADLPDSIDDRI
jgi:hypothetical protein